MAISEDVQDYVKAGLTLAPPGLTLFGVSLEAWMYLISIVAGALLIIERIPKAWRVVRGVYARLKE